MRSRGTLLMLGAVVAMGGLVWLEGMPELEPAPPQDPLASGTPLVPLFSGAPEGVSAVTIQNGSDTARVVRPEGGWDQSAEGKVVSEFLRELPKLGRIQDLEVKESELGEFGLEPAQRKVELEAGGEKPVTFELGNRNPSATGIYVRIDHGSKVFMIGALFDWEFDKLWRRLRPKPSVE